MIEMSKSLVIAVKIYRILLKLYPPAFRDHYETEMIQTFITCCRAYEDTQSWRGVLAFQVQTLVDLVITASEEWWRAWMHGANWKRSQPMSRTVDETRPFLEEVTTVMDRRPDYYQLFVTQIESLRSVGTVADCLALDADPTNPAALFAVFQEGGEGLLAPTAPRWLGRLCAAVRQPLHDLSPGPSATMANQLIQRIYADPVLFELIAAEEVGQQLVDVVESLALDGNVEEIDEMLGLMQQLGNSSQAQP